MKIENMSEKSVLKYVIITLLSIMVLTSVVVILFNLETIKNNFYDRQVGTLTAIRVTSLPLTPIFFTSG